LALCLAAGPFAATAQVAPRRHKVGVLTPAAAQWHHPQVFTAALRDLGYDTASNLSLLVRDAGGRLGDLPRLAAALVDEKVDVILAVNTPGTRAAMDATRSIPIVMVAVADPVATGFVTSLSRPGGNVTGLSTLGRDLTGKKLELLKEAVPGAGRIAVLLHPDDPIVVPQVADAKVAAARLGVEARFFDVRDVGDLQKAFAAMRQWPAQAAMRLPGQAFGVSAPSIELAFKHRLPLMLTIKEEVRAGGLMSYDPDRAEMARRSAQLIDKILKGARPGDMPVEQPTKFELVINLKTARAVGLTIPPAVLARADEVIE
jgi:putative ABC transport system substrate-binding protein